MERRARLLRAARGRRAVAGAMAAAVLGAASYAITTAAYAGGVPAGFHKITFGGISVDLPTAWPVVNLADNPSACPRLDVHAVYLGTAGPHPACPASGLGAKTEAVQIQVAVPHSPAVLGATSTVTIGGVTAKTNPDQAVSHTITDIFPSIGLQVDLSFGTGESLIQQVQSTISVSPSSAAARGPRRGLIRRLARPARVVPGQVQGIVQDKGFDACSAPSVGTMSAWLASPFRSVGVYIGGADQACAQPALTGSWVASVERRGWSVFPLYPGPQAPCVNAPGNVTFSAGNAGPAGRAAASDAAVQAHNLGFPSGTPVIYDMEGYSGCGAAVSAFLNAWDTTLHAKGYSSGVYESSGNVGDLSTRNGAMTEPDVMDYANWDGSATTGSPYIPHGMWTNHQRIHQYLGNINASFGGIGLNIDDDRLDVNLGGTVSLPTRPETAVVDQKGTVRVYDRTGPLWENHLPQGGSSWTWFDMQGNWPSDPAAVVGADDTIRVYAVGTTGNLYEQHLPPGGGWSGWADLGGKWPSGVAPVTGPDGTIRVYAVGTNGHMYEDRLPPGGAWSGWAKLSTLTFTGTPTAVVDHRGTIRVYVRTTGHDLEEGHLDSGASASWGWHSLGGKWPFNPGATVASDGSVRVYAVGNTGDLYETHLSPGGTWFPWWHMSNRTLTGTPAALTDSAGTVRVYVRSIGGNLREVHLPRGGAWSWADLSGNWPYDPAAVNASGTVRIYDVGTTGDLYEDRLPGGGSWSGWVSLGKP